MDSLETVLLPMVSWIWIPHTHTNLPFKCHLFNLYIHGIHRHVKTWKTNRDVHNFTTRVNIQSQQFCLMYHNKVHILQHYKLSSICRISAIWVSQQHSFKSSEGFFKAKGYLCKFICMLQFEKQFLKCFNLDLSATHLCMDL